MLMCSKIFFLNTQTACSHRTSALIYQTACSCRTSELIYQTACSCRKSELIYQTACSHRTSALIYQTACSCRTSALIYQTACSCRTSALIYQTACSCRISALIYQTAQCHIPSNVHSDCCGKDYGLTHTIWTITSRQELLRYSSFCFSSMPTLVNMFKAWYGHEKMHMNTGKEY